MKWRLSSHSNQCRMLPGWNVHWLLSENLLLNSLIHVVD